MSEELREKLFDKKENGWKSVNEEEKKAIFDFSKGYMDFLNQAKTQRNVLYVKRNGQKTLKMTHSKTQWTENT